MWKFGVRNFFVSSGMLGMLHLQLRTYEATVSSGGMTEAWWWKIHQLCQLKWEFRCFRINSRKNLIVGWLDGCFTLCLDINSLSQTKPNQTFEVTMWNCLQSCHNTELIKIQPTRQGYHMRLRINFIFIFIINFAKHWFSRFLMKCQEFKLAKQTKQSQMQLPHFELFFSM